MDRLRKKMVTPYFGDFPQWMEHFQPPKGYGWILDCNLKGFKERCRDILNMEYPGEWGQPKVWDLRCALGVLYEDELKDCDFWGHMDLDMIFGDIDKFVPDSLLNKLDVYSGHHSYVNGCFSLYRNHPRVNGLFLDYPHWKDKMQDIHANGWIENEYSRTLEQSGLRYMYAFPQGNPWAKELNLKKENGKLFQDGEEIGFFHFRHFKRWPL